MLRERRWRSWSFFLLNSQISPTPLDFSCPQPNLSNLYIINFWFNEYSISMLALSLSLSLSRLELHNHLPLVHCPPSNIQKKYHAPLSLHSVPNNLQFIPFVLCSSSLALPCLKWQLIMHKFNELGPKQGCTMSSVSYFGLILINLKQYYLIKQKSFW